MQKLRVYVIEANDQGSDDYSNEEFMTLAEEQGTVYTLKGFQDAFNYEYDELITLDRYIRFLNDGVDLVDNIIN